MCAQFSLKIPTQDLQDQFNIKIPQGLNLISERFLPYKKAPVIVLDQSVPRLVSMQFSLLPVWSKESRVKFATHNARLETVIEKPTWRLPFEKQHCLVPITSFFESVYTGPDAGHIIEFFKSESGLKSDLLFAAGVFDQWTDPSSPHKSIQSFAIITTEPTKYILDHGHDRSPLFLDFKHGHSWLKLKSDPKMMIEFLLTHNQKPELSVKVDRPLKAGWEKRV